MKFCSQNPDRIKITMSESKKSDRQWNDVEWNRRSFKILDLPLWGSRELLGCDVISGESTDAAGGKVDQDDLIDGCLKSR